MDMTKHAQIQLAIQSAALSTHLKAMINELKGARLVESDPKRKAGLLIAELGSTPRQDFKQMESMLESGAVQEIFLFGENPNPEILMQAMRLGVKEFFPLPLNGSDVRGAIERYLTRCKKRNPMATCQEGRIISVCGSKGGVGTTTVAVNLAVALRKGSCSQPVALLDMNTLFGEIPLFLEITPKFHWGEITKNIERLDKAFLMNVLTCHKSGVHVLPSPAYLNGHLAPTPAIIERLLTLMRRIFDIVIIDCGQSLSESALKAMQLSDEVLIISTLSLPCLGNAGRLLRSVTDLGYLKKERIKLILNRFIKKGDITLEDAEAGINQKIFWQIPNDYKTSMAAINSGKPLSELAPNSSISKNFYELAQKFLPPDQTQTKKRWSLFGK